MSYYNRRYQPVFRSGNTDMKTLLQVWAGSLALVGLTHYWLIKHGMWVQIWKVVWAGWPIWAVFAAAIAYGVTWWKIHPNFTRTELALYCAAVPFFAYPGSALGYYWLTDLHDTEVWCGQAETGEYVERYYTESTDKDGKTTRTYHGPYYYLHTSNGWTDKQSVESQQWENLKVLWGGDARVTSELNTSSDGVHFIYKIGWDGGKHSRVFTATEHPWLNLVKASSTILKVHGAMKGWEQYLVKYPEVVNNDYGPIQFNRVVEAGISLDSAFINDVNAVLYERLATLGKARECNVVLYVTSAPAAMYPALKEFWVLGHNNDIVVVIGTKDGNTVEWVETMCWADDGHAPFVGALNARIYNLKTLKPGRILAQEICAQIEAKGGEGYKRLPREKLEHLIPDVGLPFWALLVIIVINGLWLTPTVWLFIHD